MCNEKLYSHFSVNYIFKMLLSMSEMLYNSQIIELILKRKYDIISHILFSSKLNFSMVVWLNFKAASNPLTDT